MGDENELDSSAGSHSRLVPRPALSTCRAGRRCCRRHRVSSLGCSWLLVLSSPCPALLASCLSCGRFPLFLRRVCLLSVPPVLPYRRIARLPAARQVWRGEYGVRFGLGSPRPLLPVACRGGAVDVARAVPLVGLARCRRVDGVSCLRDLRRSRCLLRSRRHGLIVIGCCRRGSVSSSVAVARCRLVLLALWCHCRSLRSSR